MAEEKKTGSTYKDAGVNIDAGNRAVDLVKKKVEETFDLGPGKMNGKIGGFSAGVEIFPEGPVISGSADGVGTKIRIAIILDFIETIGIDLVAMSANDVITDGSDLLFFLDYVAMGKQNPERTEKILDGIIEGCMRAGVRLIGGEMAEMPGFYKEDEFDLAGFCVGIASNKKSLIHGENMRSGFSVWGLPSSGLHSNGFSLVRKVFGINDNDPEDARVRLNMFYPELGRTLGEELLEPTRIYAKDVRKVLNKIPIAGMVHITGGGFVDNPPRILPDGLAMKIDASTWREPAIFDLIRKRGDVDEDEMIRTFNLGIGYLIITPPSEFVSGIIPDATQIGEIVESPTKDTFFE